MTRDEWFAALAEWHAEIRKMAQAGERVTVGERSTFVPTGLQAEACAILKREGKDVGPW